MTLMSSEIKDADQAGATEVCRWVGATTEAAAASHSTTALEVDTKAAVDRREEEAMAATIVIATTLRATAVDTTPRPRPGFRLLLVHQALAPACLLRLRRHTRTGMEAAMAATMVVVVVEEDISSSSRVMATGEGEATVPRSSSPMEGSITAAAAAVVIKVRGTVNHRLQVVTIVNMEEVMVVVVGVKVEEDITTIGGMTVGIAAEV